MRNMGTWVSTPAVTAAQPSQNANRLRRLTKISLTARRTISRRAIGGHRHSVLGKQLVGDPEAVDGGRYSGIDHDLQEHLADLGRRHAIVERAADVRLELVGTVEHADHGQV